VEARMSKDTRRKAATGCPVGIFFKNLDGAFGAGSDIGGHLQRSQLELLKAIRAWAEGRIEHLEKQHPSKRKKKVTKIEVG
jgi:hypothetical protein